MNSAREVGRRGPYSLLGLVLQVLSCRMEISQRLATPGCLSPRHSVNGAARESVSCMMPLAGSMVNYGQETGVMTQVWELLSILLHGSVKCLSQANPVTGSILKKPKRAEMTHCSPSPSQGCPLAVPSHHPGPKRTKSLPFSCSCPWLYGMAFKFRKILLEAG